MYETVRKKIVEFEKKKKSGAVYAIVSSFFYVTVGLCVKQLKGISATQILLLRCVISQCPNCLLITAGKHNIYPKDKHVFNLLMMRCVFGSIGHICYFQAISMLNLSDAQAIFLMSPIWTIILSSVLLSEKLGREIIALISLSFLGIILIMKPPILLEALGISNPMTTNPEITNNNHSMFYLGIIAAFGFSFLDSVSSVLIRSLSDAVPVTAILQYVYLSGCAFNGILLIVKGEFSLDIYQVDVMLMLILLSCLNFFAQIFSSRAVQLGTPQEIQPLMYSQLVMSFLVDILLLDKQLSVFSLFGSALILLANFQIIAKKT